MEEVEIVNLLENNYCESGYSVGLVMLKCHKENKREYIALLLPFGLEQPSQLNTELVHELKNRYKIELAARPSNPIENMFTYWLKQQCEKEIT